jgi:hypothetical protein
MASFTIFPTSLYGQASDVYGTAVTAYANTNGFPGGSGLVLGQFGVLFDGTELRLFKANAGIAQYNAVKFVIGNSNDYTVINTATVNVDAVAAVNDRAGSTALVANNIAWMTSRGIGTANVAASITAPVPLASSATAGQLGAFTAGTSLYPLVQLLNTTTTAGSYPVKIIN